MALKNLTPQEQQADLIQRFINQELDEAERLKVEKRIVDDPNFAEEVQLYRSLIGNMKAIRRDEMVTNLDQWYQEHEFNQVEIQPWWQQNWYYAAAAVLVVLLACYLAWDTSTKTYTDQELYTEAFQAYPAEVPRKIQKRTNLIKGISFYNIAKYDSASYYLSKARQDSSYSVQYALFLGIAFLENGNSNKAIEQFNLLLNPPNKIFGETARWYLALAYLKEGNRIKASEILEKITENDRHFNKKEANELLEKIN